MIAMGLALVLYIVFPAAPPRYLPEWGFTDTVASFVGEQEEQSVNALYNPFAAVPSMHVAFALMIGIPAIEDRQAPHLQGACGHLPGDRHVRRHGHRQPLLARRLPRRARRRVVAASASSYLLGRARPEAWAWRTDASARGRSLAWRPPPGGVGVRASPGARARRRDARDRAQPADRVAPDAELHLDDGPRRQPDRRGARARRSEFFLAGIAFILGSVMDTLDGRYSRMSGKGTPFGAFLDSSLDRIEEGIVLAAVGAYFAKQGDEPAVAAVVLAVLFSLMVSYTRARAEALGVECKVGIGSRAVRVVIISAGLLFATGPGDVELLEPAVYVLAGLGIITTGQRMWHVRNELNAPTRPRSSLEPAQRLPGDRGDALERGVVVEDRNTGRLGGRRDEQRGVADGAVADPPNEPPAARTPIAPVPTPARRAGTRASRRGRRGSRRRRRGCARRTAARA